MASDMKISANIQSDSRESLAPGSHTIPPVRDGSLIGYPFGFG